VVYGRVESHATGRSKAYLRAVGAADSHAHTHTLVGGCVGVCITGRVSRTSQVATIQGFSALADPACGSTLPLPKLESSARKRVADAVDEPCAVACVARDQQGSRDQQEGRGPFLGRTRHGTAHLHYNCNRVYETAHYSHAARIGYGWA
jgi:hypothetical protein